MAAVPGLSDAEKAAIISEASQDSDVPILMSVGSQMNMNSSTTRAPLESNPTTGLFSTPANQFLGVFCLAQKKQAAASELAAETADITWDGDTPLGSLDSNMKARVVLLEEKNELGGDDPNIIGTVRTYDAQSEIQFMEGDAQKMLYYPTASWYNYHFYTYYPRLTSGVTCAAKKVTVNYTLNGTQDIIWGKAVPTTTTSLADPESDVDRGFNAKYFRDKADANGLNTIDQLPKLQLNHCLAQVRFWIKVANSDAAYYDQYVTDEGNELKLKNVEVIKMPNDWQLTVADKQTPLNEGTFAFNFDGDEEDVATAMSTVNVKQMTVNGAGAATASNDENVFDIADPDTYMDVTKVYQFIGYVMIPTTPMYAAAHTAYSAIPASPQVKVYMKVGNDPVELGDLTLPTPTGGFQAGKVYNIRLDLTIPRPVAATASLESWTTVGVEEESDQNLNLPIGGE